MPKINIVDIIIIITALLHTPHPLIAMKELEAGAVIHAHAYNK